MPSVWPNMECTLWETWPAAPSERTLTTETKSCYISSLASMPSCSLTTPGDGNRVPLQTSRHIARRITASAPDRFCHVLMTMKKPGWSFEKWQIPWHWDWWTRPVLPISLSLPSAMIRKISKKDIAVILQLIDMVVQSPNMHTVPSILMPSLLLPEKL